jgi:hypothetical protein
MCNRRQCRRYRGLVGLFPRRGQRGQSVTHDVAGAFNGEELSHAATTGDAATWTFANLDPTAYYDVYVNWTPLAGATTQAQYAVSDGGTPIQPIGVGSIPTFGVLPAGVKNLLTTTGRPGRGRGASGVPCGRRSPRSRL